MKDFVEANDRRKYFYSTLMDKNVASYVAFTLWAEQRMHLAYLEAGFLEDEKEED